MTELLSKLEYVMGNVYWSSSAYVNCRGKPAGTLSGTGYVYIEYKGHAYKRSRIVWEMHHGSIPPGMVVEHKDGVRNNDAISNLQLTTQQENILLGTPALQSRNTSGYTGVYLIKKRSMYQASARINKRNISFGYYETAELARDARAAGLINLNLESRRP